jgi:ketosteroid isomerase-like protein
MDAQRRVMLAAAATGLGGCATGAAPAGDRDRWVREVTEAETAFARSMAERKLAAFAAFVADDAVFLNGGRPLRGKAAVLAHWARFFEGAQAPFSWQPELVEVLETGRLAQSIGPVSAPDGRVVARFYSTWRREGDGRWRVVLDNGDAVCAAPKA